MNLARVGSFVTCDEAENGLKIRVETAEGIESKRDNISGSENMYAYFVCV
jgi:hypothetical protein